MRAVADFKICPNCGTRNKPKWEFCVKCGESLEGLTLVSGMPSPVAAAEAAPVVVEEAEEAGEGLGTTLVGLAAVLAVVGVAYHISSNPNKADAALFVGPATANTGVSVPPAPPPEPPSRLDEGRRLLLRGDPGALQRLAEAAAESPNDPTAHYAYAQALWQAGQQEEALSHYQLAAQLEGGGSVKYRFDYAKSLTALGRNAEAKAVYDAILASRPDSPGVLRDLASLAIQGGQPDQAVALLSRAAELTPQRAAVQEELGHALEKAGDTPKAIEAYNRAIELSPDSEMGRNLLADLLFREKRPDEAIALLRAGLDRKPDAAMLHRGLGSILERAGRPSEAAAEYREYARLAPQAADAQSLSERADRLEKQAPAPPGEN
jgi:tetratricopeptide (TPR) repeat protein